MKCPRCNSKFNNDDLTFFKKCDICNVWLQEKSPIPLALDLSITLVFVLLAIASGYSYFKDRYTLASVLFGLVMVIGLLAVLYYHRYKITVILELSQSEIESKIRKFRLKRRLILGGSLACYVM